ncbi:MAG: hypothetical protein JSS67_03590 [Bacteroidetes bacterium]|nr:hypothetical protein [Bacteroidota bacterium]
MADILYGEPQTITAGDRVQWKLALADFAPADGWTLHYVLLATGLNPITIVGSASGTDHLVDIAAATTAGWVAGGYNWTSYVVNGSDRRTIGSGFVTIAPDPTTQTISYDPRTLAQKILAQIQTALAQELSNPLSEYRIGDRTVKRDPGTKDELLRMEAIFKARVAREQGTGGRIVSIPITFLPNYGVSPDPGGTLG